MMTMQQYAEAARHSRRKWSQGTVLTLNRCVLTNDILGDLNAMPACPGRASLELSGSRGAQYPVEEGVYTAAQQSDGCAFSKYVS